MQRRSPLVPGPPERLKNLEEVAPPAIGGAGYAAGLAPGTSA
jgi:hypothetical protein